MWKNFGFFAPTAKHSGEGQAGDGPGRLSDREEKDAGRLGHPRPSRGL